MALRSLLAPTVATLQAELAALQASFSEKQWYEWISDPVTPADLAGGANTKESLLLSSTEHGAFPYDAIPIAAYVKIIAAPVSTDAATTACYIALGYPGSPTAEGAYLQVGANLLGTTLEHSGHWSGNFLGGCRYQGDPYLTITAGGGGSERTAHLSAFSFQAGLRYWLPPT